MKIYIFILLFLCFCMCSSDNKRERGTEILITGLPKIGIIKYEDSRYLKNSKVIKLETIEASVIGHIVQVEVYDNKIYILSGLGYTSQLLVFDLKGNYLNSIGTRGHGPEEYLNIQSFYIDEDESVISIIDNMTSTVIQHDKYGNFLKRIKHNNPLLNFVKKAKVIGDKIFCYSVTNWQNNNMYFVLLKNDFSTIKEIRKYPGKPTIREFHQFSFQPFSCTGEVIYYGALFTDTIFSYTHSDDSISTYFVAQENKININTRMVEEMLVKFNYDYSKVVKEVTEKDKYNIGIFNYFENKRYILWDFMATNPEKRAILWDKKEEKGGYVEYGHYTPDFSSFLSSFGNTIIRVWNNDQIQIFKDELHENNSMRNEYYTEIINLVEKHNLEEDNPMLIFYEFKED